MVVVVVYIKCIGNDNDTRVLLSRVGIVNLFLFPRTATNSLLSC